jgi:hypothetical protein
MAHAASWALAASLLLGAAPALAQTSARPADASIVEWAKLRIEAVCKRHEEQQRFEQAAKCYDEVSAILARSNLRTSAPVTAPVRAAMRPAPLPPRVTRTVEAVAEAPPPAAAKRGCANLLCSRYVVLGVGF